MPTDCFPAAQLRYHFPCDPPLVRPQLQVSGELRAIAGWLASVLLIGKNGSGKVTQEEARNEERKLGLTVDWIGLQLVALPILQENSRHDPLFVSRSGSGVSSFYGLFQA